MNPPSQLSPQNQAYLLAAQGWLELGNPLEANEELERIEPKSRAHPDVLLVRYDVYAAASRWDVCLTIAEAAVEAEPASLEAWKKLLVAARKSGPEKLLAVWEAASRKLQSVENDTWLLLEAAVCAATVGDLSCCWSGLS